MPVRRPARGQAARGRGRGAGILRRLEMGCLYDYPKRAEAQRLRRQRRPVQNSVTIVNLATGTKTETPKIRRFAFSGDAATWIALHRAPAQPTPGGGAGAGAAPAAGAGGGAATPAAGGPPIARAARTSSARAGRRGRSSTSATWPSSPSRGTASCSRRTIDATDKVGNGVQLRNMLTGTVARGTDSGEALRAPDLDRKRRGLAVLKGTEDRAYSDKRLLGHRVHRLRGGAPQKMDYDPATDKSFPKGMTISRNRNPQWTEDLQALTFGIHTPRKRRRRPTLAQARPRRSEGEDATRPRRRQRAPTPTTERPTRRSISCSGTGRTRACSRSRKCRSRATGSSAISPSTASAEEVHPPRGRRGADGETSRRSSGSPSASTTASTS